MCSEFMVARAWTQVSVACHPIYQPQSIPVLFSFEMLVVHLYLVVKYFNYILNLNLDF